MRFGTVLACIYLTVFTIETDADEGVSKVSRIINGIKAKKGRYDYYVQGNGKEGMCGGFLIAPNVVLTAISCDIAFNRKVLVGSYRKRNDEQSGEYIKIKKIIKHPDYDEGTLANDYMLVVLERDSNYTPVCIADITYDMTLGPGTQLYAIGFGRKSSFDLMEVNLPYIDNDECQDLIEVYYITDTMMCMGLEKRKAAISRGRGGPLIRRGDDASEDIVVGIVSWGMPTGKHPGVYARVGKAHNWIQSIVENNKGKLATCATQPDPNYEYIGCYKEDKEDKVFDYQVAKRGASVEDCAALCKGSNYFFREGKGRCYCGEEDHEDYDRHGKSGKCNCGWDSVGKNIGCVYKLQPLKSGCYDGNRDFIPGCSCHSSCKNCGFYDDPIDLNDCIECADGGTVNIVYSDGTGTCPER